MVKTLTLYVTDSLKDTPILFTYFCFMHGNLACMSYLLHLALNLQIFCQQIDKKASSSKMNS